MPISVSGPPLNDSIVQLDPQDPQRSKPFYASLEWARYFLDVFIPALQASTSTKATLTLTGQHATVALTSLGMLQAGTYLVSYYARITTPDGVASSLIPTIGWTESGVALSTSFAAMTGDSITTVQSGTLLIFLDPSSAITMGATYFSTTPNQMKFRLSATAVLVG